MKEDAKGFVMLPSFVEQLEKINNDAVQLALYRAICRYGFYSEIPDFSDIDKFGMLDAVFYSVQRLIDWTKEQRNKKAQIARKNGLLSNGNPYFEKGKPNPYYLQEDNQDITNDNQDISIKEKRKEVKEESRKSVGKKTHTVRFQIPTLEEIKSFIQEKGYNVDADEFYNHYTANGWHIGINKMTNWEAAVGYWQSSHNHKGDDVDLSERTAADYNTSF